MTCMKRRLGAFACVEGQLSDRVMSDAVQEAGEGIYASTNARNRRGGGLSLPTDCPRLGAACRRREVAKMSGTIIASVF